MLGGQRSVGAYKELEQEQVIVVREIADSVPAHGGNKDINRKR